MTSQIINSFRNFFNKTRKNKDKEKEKETDRPVIITDPLDIPLTPPPSPYSPSPKVSARRKTKRSNSLRRRAILQSYSKKIYSNN